MALHKKDRVRKYMGASLLFKAGVQTLYALHEFISNGLNKYGDEKIKFLRYDNFNNMGDSK